MTRPAIRPFIRADLDWLVATHDRLYAQEAGFDATFGAVVRAAAQQLLDRADPRELGFVAEVAKARVGSIFSTRLDDDTGQVRLFLILPDWRGSGLAPRMLAAAEGFARAQGCTRMRLWTHESHAAACALYAREGWRRGPRCPVHNYGQDLVEVRWDKDLAEIALPD